MELESKIAKAKLLQARMAKQVVARDVFAGPVRFIAGADVAYDDAGQVAAGVLAVLDADSLSVIEMARATVPQDFPYVPGLFSFREVPPLLAAWQTLQQRPDLIICDGHGLVDPRRFGLACHLGVTLEVPTIGCAKKPLIGSIGDLDTTRGATQPIVYRGETLGMAVRTQSHIKPVYVSVGHRVALDTAVARVLATAPEYRQPETTRVANEAVNAHLANYLATNGPEAEGPP